ncbi:hypothetical protein [Actinoplanes sp. DH11]|uniref:hypothetical protein n=1 Tax=Actinoplanes sp. DH11 TaxID=2857011 RepID=UPI001E49E24D|nr:hypothetical protein [Actinoplanes sp. DH11]
MSWLRRSSPARRPAHAVDGVEPHHDSDGVDHYTGDALAGQPAVEQAVARLPQDPALEYLLYSMGLSTADGVGWTLSFGDESLILFGLSHPGGSDVFEHTLAAAPFTTSVERADRDIFVFTTPGPLTADTVLAHCLDVCGEVYRGLAA